MEHATQKIVMNFVELLILYQEELAFGFLGVIDTIANVKYIRNKALANDGVDASCSINYNVFSSLKFHQKLYKIKSKHVCDDLEMEIEPFMQRTSSDPIIADNGSYYYSH